METLVKLVQVLMLCTKDVVNTPVQTDTITLMDLVLLVPPDKDVPLVPLLLLVPPALNI